MSSQDTWTTAHDLALVYLALAYGTDHQISDRELSLIREAIGRADGSLADAERRDVVLEALAVYLDDVNRAPLLVHEALLRLHETLSLAERQQAIEDVVRIAEADGFLLLAERNLIRTIAEAWQVKRFSESLLEASTAQQDEEWTLLHDIGLIYIVVAHSTDNQLTDPEIQAIIAATGEWHPDWSEEQVRAVLRRALRFYSEQPEATTLRRSVQSIRERLPLIQRLALVNDLYRIAESDGDLLDSEQEMISTLMQAWEVGLRLNGWAKAGVVE